MRSLDKVYGICRSESRPFPNELLVSNNELKLFFLPLFVWGCGWCMSGCFPCLQPFQVLAASRQYRKGSSQWVCCQTCSNPCSRFNFLLYVPPPFGGGTYAWRRGLSIFSSDQCFVNYGNIDDTTGCWSCYHQKVGAHLREKWNEIWDWVRPNRTLTQLIVIPFHSYKVCSCTVVVF